MFLKYFLLLNIVIVICSCGFPDASSIRVDLNQPYITRVVPGDEELTVYFESQNNEEGFSGYNIYYGDNVDQKEYILLNPNNLFPTITAIKSDTINMYEFTIKKRQNYSNENGVGQLRGSDIANGLPRYIVVTAYDLFNNYESSYAYSNFVVMGCPRPEINNSTVNVDTSFEIRSKSLGTLQNNAGVLQVLPPTDGGIQMRPATSIDDIISPPENGYVSTPIDAKAGRLYLLETSEGEYGKVYIQSVDTSSVVADYCIQLAEGITNY